MTHSEQGESAAMTERETMTGIELITAERQRQITGEGWTPEHDDTHNAGELAEAAACYTDLAAYQSANPGSTLDLRRPMGWPWAASWWKPSSDPIRNLAKAGALIAAEIDRLQRLEAHDET
jgi:hypothetical protein